ncbi:MULTISPECIES: bifunctional DNA primase/polymerase [unclassified Agrococcus]|uniref:bifunctional DNA primase/polymerase n=1 Tax=unclassified Agrococcus TaxID=2615065 RepID=UPI0036134C67
MTLEAALDLAAKGFHVFALTEGSKEPLKGSRGLHDATRDAEALATAWGAHPRANVGIATGHDGLVVLDVDVKDGAPGLESLRRLCKRTGLDLDAVPMVDTPSGGLHLYFRDRRLAGLRNSVSKLAPGIDVRAAGGYVVAPPSRIGGRRYAWRAR